MCGDMARRTLTARRVVDAAPVEAASLKLEINMGAVWWQFFCGAVQRDILGGRLVAVTCLRAARVEDCWVRAGGRCCTTDANLGVFG